MRHAEIYMQDQLNSLAKQSIQKHITVPGVQAKLSLHLERKNRSGVARLTRDGFDGGYILKPSVSPYPYKPELEHLTLRMARVCGINTAECGLIALEEGLPAGWIVMAPASCTWKICASYVKNLKRLPDEPEL